ncbi:hypothetical protein FRC08_016967 [Ceratobasidium sp. 394]|nr:hypothetical protein FRC08_016967 [Ceratobasidium sp. 394]
MPGIKFLPAPGRPNVAWVFKGKNYGRIEWAPGPEPGVALQKSKPISEGWPSLVKAGFEYVDAAVHMGEETVFFSGDRMAAVHIDRENYNDTLKAGPYPLTKWNALKETGFTSVDALLAVPDRPEEYFVFSGHECARISYNPDKVIYGRGTILDRWATLPFINVDTTLPHPTESSDVYFFTGATYVRVTVTPGTNKDKIHHDPYNTPHQWPSLVAVGFFDSPNVLLSAEFDGPYSGRVTKWDGERGFGHIPPPASLRLYTVWRTASGDHVEGDVLHLDKFLGAEDGELHWGGEKFQKHARAIEITGNVSKTDSDVPRIILHVRFDHETVGHGRTAAIDLTGMLELQVDNKVVAIIPAEIAVRRQHLDELGRKMDEYLTKHAKNLKVVKVASDGPKTEESSDGFKSETLYVYADAGPKDKGTVIKTYSARAQATVTHLTDKHFKGDFLSVEADAQAGPTGAFAGAGAYGAKVEYGPLEVDGGLAVEVGVGIKDDSLNVEAGVFDFTIGRKFGIHVLGAGFSIDFGKVCTIM